RVAHRVGAGFEDADANLFDNLPRHQDGIERPLLLVMLLMLLVMAVLTVGPNRFARGAGRLGASTAASRPQRIRCGTGWRRRRRRGSRRLLRINRDGGELNPSVAGIWMDGVGVWRPWCLDRHGIEFDAGVPGLGIGFAFIGVFRVHTGRIPQ